MGSEMCIRDRSGNRGRGCLVSWLGPTGAYADNGPRGMGDKGKWGIGVDGSGQSLNRPLPILNQLKKVSYIP